MADETFPHLDGARDEEVALAQWQRREIDELRSANALLEAQLETERQRVERLMAVERAAREACDAFESKRADRTPYLAMKRLRAALETTDGE